MKTYLPKIDSQKRKWWVLDLDGLIMGRAAVKVANVLRGKDKPIFTPHLDTGDNVIAVNASKLRVTGTNKPNQLTYYRYSGYPGGLKRVTYAEQMNKKPERVFVMAVKRMLPKNRLGRKMLKKLHVYPGADHVHKAQKPTQLNLN